MTKHYTLMIPKSLYPILFVFLTISCKAQNSTVWNNYVKAKQTGSEPILPDFSYAGYKFSEVPIPHVDYKVFDVTTFGAIPNDTISDKRAIKAAIKAASVNGEGVIFFPKGKYYINTIEDDKKPILISSSKIVFRGEDNSPNGSVIFLDQDLPPTNPEKLWTVPYVFKTDIKDGDTYVTDIVGKTRRETHTITVKDASSIKVGDWVILKVLNNDKDLVAKDIHPLKADPSWAFLHEEGVQVNERHQVTNINGNVVTFKAPVHYNIDAKHGWKLYKFKHLENIGFENILFEGRWTKKFKHHRSTQDDGGWSAIQLSKTVNSWIKDCSFKNVNRVAGISGSAACTAINLYIEGNIGHSSISASGGSTGILLANINDMAGMHHATGVGGGSTTGTVIWRSQHASHTSFEAHASQPRCTLFDNVKGGFFKGRAGGARHKLPNHGRYLVLWNYEETDEPQNNFNFISKDTWFWKIVPPIIVGFHGSGTTFNKNEVQILESLGTPVKPESLFEAQLKLRLGYLPQWLSNLKKRL